MHVTYVFLYMYKQNDEQTLIHTKVTIGEHETQSLHLCQIATRHTTQVYTLYISLADPGGRTRRAPP